MKITELHLKKLTTPARGIIKGNEELAYDIVSGSLVYFLKK